MLYMFKGVSKTLVIVALVLAAIVGGLLFSVAFKQPPPASSTPTTPTSTVPPPPLSFPRSDVEGRDLPDVPRYAGSVRIYYRNETYGNALFIDLAYYTHDSVDEVVGFYEEQMPNYNWSLLKKEEVSGELELPWIKLKTKSYVFLDFRRPGCTDPQTCLPYAKISIGEIVQENVKYTIIQINFEDYARKPGETQTPTETPSGFGAKFAEYIKEVLSSAFNIPEPKLVKYEGGKSPLVEFDIGKPVADPMKAAEQVRSSLEKTGIPESVIMVEKEDSTVLVIVISWELYGEIGSINIRLQPGSSIVEAYFVTI